jgi:hypothetical protein
MSMKASFAMNMPDRAYRAYAPRFGERAWLAKIRWRAGHDYRELKNGLGLDHFEGRSYTG